MDTFFPFIHKTEKPELQKQVFIELYPPTVEIKENNSKIEEEERGIIILEIL